MRVNGGNKANMRRLREKFSQQRKNARKGSAKIGHTLIVYYDQRAESIKRNETEASTTENEAPTSDVSSS